MSSSLNLRCHVVRNFYHEVSLQTPKHQRQTNNHGPKLPKPGKKSGLLLFPHRKEGRGRTSDPHLRYQAHMPPCQLYATFPQRRCVSCSQGLQKY
ncbi:hypothetical protein LEMLEM_LOCUS22694 [Lemmus lemmus]